MQDLFHLTVKGTLHKNKGHPKNMRSIEGKTLKSSIIISLYTSLTSIFNYLTLFLLAFTFWTRMEMDAYFAAITIPQIITAVLLATLSTTFIPVFIEVRMEDESRAWKLASISVNLVFFLLVLIAFTGSILSKDIIAQLNPGFPEETLSLASSLFRILLISVVFSGTSIILSSLYYAHHRFVKAPFFQWLSSCVTFFFVLSFRSSWGIKSIAAGTLVGSLIQFLSLLPIIRRRYSFSFNFKDKEIVKLSRLIIPLLIGSIFYRSNTLVERFIASRLGEGIISYLGYSYKIIMALVLLINQGISTVLFPRMSEYSAVKDFVGLKETLSKGIRALIIITVPIAFIIILARSELVAIIFERGNFSHYDTIAVSKALIAYLGLFVVGAISLPIVNTLYSIQETKKVASVGIFGFLIYVIMAFILSHYFSYIGIALAVSIQYIISIILFIYILKKKSVEFERHEIFCCTFKVILASGLTSFFILGSRKLLKSMIGFPLDLIVFGILGFCLYFLVLIILKTEELKFLKTTFQLLKKYDS